MSNWTQNTRAQDVSLFAMTAPGLEGLGRPRVGFVAEYDIEGVPLPRVLRALREGRRTRPTSWEAKAYVVLPPKAWSELLSSFDPYEPATMVPDTSGGAPAIVYMDLYIYEGSPGCRSRLVVQQDVPHGISEEESKALLVDLDKVASGSDEGGEAAERLRKALAPSVSPGPLLYSSVGAEAR